MQVLPHSVDVQASTGVTSIKVNGLALQELEMFRAECTVDIGVALGLLVLHVADFLHYE